MKKKAYIIYVSDYHFEMISLLNIKKELKQNKKIIILTQNNLEKTIKTLISKLNLKDEEKKQIQKIDWTNNEKYEEIKKAVEKNEEISIYIKGDEKYIETQNQKIEPIIEKNKAKVQITDCYDFNEIEEKNLEITNKYEKKIITSK